MLVTAIGYRVHKNEKVHFLNFPLDGGLLFFDREPILGPARTVTGFLVALFLGTLGWVVAPSHGLFTIAILVWAGDVLGSFLKRRWRIRPGKFLPGIDHVDYILCAGGAGLIEGYLTPAALLFAYVFTLLITPLATYIGYRLHLRGAPL